MRSVCKDTHKGTKAHGMGGPLSYIYPGVKCTDYDMPGSQVKWFVVLYNLAFFPWELPHALRPPGSLLSILSIGLGKEEGNGWFLLELASCSESLLWVQLTWGDGREGHVTQCVLAPYPHTNGAKIHHSFYLTLTQQWKQLKCCEGSVDFSR